MYAETGAGALDQTSHSHSQQPKKHRETSMTVFRRYLILTSKPDGTTSIDASAIHSKEAFDDWLKSRGPQMPTDPAKIFQRTLTAHLSGSDGRASFDPKEEAAILEVLRRKSPWPCFAGTFFANKGSLGYRSLGFHEKSKFVQARMLTCITDRLREAHDSAAAVVSKRTSSSSRPSPKKSQTAKGPLVAPPMVSDQESAGAKTSTWSDTALMQAHSLSLFPSNLPSNSPISWTNTPGPEIPIQSDAELSATNEQLNLSALDSVSHVLSSFAQEVETKSSVEHSHQTLPGPPSFLAAQDNIEQPPTPTLEQAMHLITNFEHTYPDYAVLVLNTLTSQDLADLFIAQNDSSVPWIGAIARSHMGIARALVNDQEFPGMVRTLLLLAQGGVGGEVDMVCRVILVDSVEQWIQLKLRQGAQGLVCVGARVS